MCARTDAANEVRDAALCLSIACIEKTPRSYRENLDDTLNEGLPSWAEELLKRLK